MTCGCNEDEILKEVPVDFASPENAFVTANDFQIAVNHLYGLTRENFSTDESSITELLVGTDLGFNSRGQLNIWFGDYQATLTSQSADVRNMWSRFYKLVSSANIVLSRLERAEINEMDKVKIEAEARFFRGLAYKTLAHLFGGVPLQLEEVRTPKTDYVRATREEVYLQVVNDLEFASQNLPKISEVMDGEASNLAAYHALTEVYLSLGRYDDAIAAATIVIDDPGTALMTERFGSRMNEPGDVYWDLFRRGNQNRSSGNTEAIYVFQYELDVFGGVFQTGERSGPLLERNAAPRVGTFNYRDPNGVNPFLGRVSDYTGGRGIGRLRGTSHFTYGIWQDDWEDMRNSQYNMVRDVAFNNPESVWFGQMLSSQKDLFFQTLQDSLSRFYPYPSKVTTPGNHPEGMYENLETGFLINAAGVTYTDQYFMRLAETYLLRAEAYLGKNDLSNAAVDINIVRARANAAPVKPEEIDIDYLLDERLRELHMEEERMLTLTRLGLVYDRVSRYADGNPDVTVFGLNVQPHNNLWPIPFSEIERNTDAVLEQNPGYSAL